MESVFNVKNCNCNIYNKKISNSKGTKIINFHDDIHKSSRDPRLILPLRGGFELELDKEPNTSINNNGNYNTNNYNYYKTRYPLYYTIIIKGCKPYAKEKLSIAISSDASCFLKAPLTTGFQLAEASFNSTQALPIADIFSSDASKP